MRSTRSLAAAAAVALLAIPAAHAADLPPLAAPFMRAPEDFSGWYLRGNIGATNQQVKSLDLVPLPSAFAGDSLSTPFLNFDSSPFIGLGVGYQFNQWLRADVTAEFRSKASFHGQIVDKSGGVTLPDNMTASKSEWLFLANAYVDLGTWWCVTPFVGAGIGTSRNTIHNFMDFGATQSGLGGGSILSTTFFDDASKWNFAWALYAGLAYQVTPAFTVEFAYRYLNLGSATTGTPHAFDGTAIPTSPFVFTGLTSNDFMLGLRWKIGEPDYAPPLMRKG